MTFRSDCARCQPDFSPGSRTCRGVFRPARCASPALRARDLRRSVFGCAAGAPGCLGRWCGILFAVRFFFGLVCFFGMAVGFGVGFGGGIELLAVDGQALVRELGGGFLTDTADAADEVVPVLEWAALALFDDFAGQTRADAFDAFELGGGSLVRIHCGKRRGGVQHGDDEQYLFQHGKTPSVGMQMHVHMGYGAWRPRNRSYRLPPPVSKLFDAAGRVAVPGLAAGALPKMLARLEAAGGAAVAHQRLDGMIEGA